jgi:hypothetical protein
MNSRSFTVRIASRMARAYGAHAHHTRVREAAPLLARSVATDDARLAAAALKLSACAAHGAAM